MTTRGDESVFIYPATESFVSVPIVLAPVDEARDKVVANEHTGNAQTLVTIIQPRSGWQVVQWRELFAYRDLFRFLVWREIKVRYAQSTVGIGWAVIQPVFSMIVFSIVFGSLAKVSSDGVPYAVFSLTALVPWMYFSNALTDGVNSLLTNAGMLRKIYFPRLLMPLSAVVARILDFSIATLVLIGLLVWYQISPNWGVLMMPYLLLLMVLSASGVALWLTALAIQYRDVKHALNFVVQILMYATPVVYPASLVPASYQILYALNPMVGVIEGFRACLLGTRPMPWLFLLIGTITGVSIATSGLLYFRNRERVFADVA